MNAAPPPQPHAVVEDALFLRCRDQWRRGDWRGLLETPSAEWRSHPAHARLALMIAAAHQALGRIDDARRLARKAIEWGCDRALVARVLLAGVHNTLGRAAVAGGGLGERALHHFREAVAPGGQHTAARLLLQARVHEQLEQMRLGREALPLLAGPHAPATPAAALRQLQDDLHQVTGQLSGQVQQKLNEQSRHISRLQRQTEQALTRELGNAVRQLESHARLQHYLGERLQVPELHGWPISPDFGVLLVNLVEQHEYDLIVEFGSGTSTVLMAAAIERVTPRRQARGLAPTLLLSLEHLAEYCDKTRRLLRASGFDALADVVHAPLAPYTAVDGTTSPFYTAPQALQAVVQRLARPLPACRVLLMVDGPPAATGPRARYPALSLALEHLPGAELHVLLDDYRREDEKQVVRDWCRDLVARGPAPQVTEYPLEKEACLVRTR